MRARCPPSAPARSCASARARRRSWNPRPPSRPGPTHEAPGMRFASAHKLVTYLLVLAALAPVSALAFLAACALSFAVEAGGRVARALDRAALGVRAIAIAIFAVIA